MNHHVTAVNMLEALASNGKIFIRQRYIILDQTGMVMFKCEIFTACKLIHNFKPIRVKAENGSKQPSTGGPRPINPEPEEVW